jgi:hypothetical protein
MSSANGLGKLVCHYVPTMGDVVACGSLSERTDMKPWDQVRRGDVDEVTGGE